MMSTKIRILIIDDDASIRAALVALFKIQGWEGYTATTVPEGLQLFQDCSPHLVIIDYHMPSISGLKGVEFLRGLSQTVPILVLTVEEDQAVADAFLEAGASDFVLKPVRGPDIIARINLHIRLLAQQRGVEQQTVGIFVKGIVPATQQVILDFLDEQVGQCSMDSIAQGTGLAYQTVSRYLQHMVAANLVEVVTTYGKVGRPRQHYRVKGQGA